jgi:diacylglycerol O-acyltransferase
MTVDRMSPLDASFLHMEDNVSHMHIGSVAVFAGPPPPFAEVRAMLRGKLALVPRYRQVARFVPFDLGRPVWVDDQHFNLEYHLRHTALPSPGSEEQLRLLVSRLMGLPLDRARPLWEMWMVEGLEGGRWAIVSKVHHAIVDGVSGAELLSIIMDLSPEPSPPVPDHWEPEPGPSSFQLATQAISDMARSPYEQLRAARAALRVPRHAMAQLSEVLHGVRSMSNLAQQTPQSTLNGPIGPHRRYAWTDITVPQIKHVREHVGGTFNDVVLAAITGGFRDLLLARGESVDRVVRTLVPVSVRPRDASGVAVGDGVQENRVSAMFADLPIELTDPVERLNAVSAQMDGLKDSKQAMAGEALTSLTGFAPPLLLALGGRIMARAPQRSLNTVTTNVPGPQLPLYCRGRLMEKAYGYVPLMGHIRVGIAIFSYNGDLTFGVTGDYDTTDDIEVLCRGIERSMQELLDLADAAVRREARAAAATRPRAKPRARTATGGQSGTAASTSNKRRAAG